jgi:hypothetical protein
MTTELTRYNGYRYVLHKGRSFSDDAEKMKAGHAMLMHADMVVWESNAALVARVESFLQKGFSWYSKNPKPARETLQTLLAYVRDGAVIVSQENGATTDVFENGGFTLDPPARKDRPDPPPFDYYARGAANRASLLEYNAVIDAREERERVLNTPSFEAVKQSEMPYLLSLVRMVARSESVRREALRKAASGFSKIADKAATKLGDAAPFEYGKSATGDDVLSIAARGVSEAIETQCMAEYERALDMCRAVAYPMGLDRGMALCRENTFDRYQQCRGY